MKCVLAVIVLVGAVLATAVAAKLFIMSIAAAGAAVALFVIGGLLLP